MGFGRKDLRAAVGLLAVFGMLMHAVLLTRQHTMVVAAALGASSVQSLAGVICRADGTMTPMADLNGPVAPSEPDMQGTCPLCLGAVAANAVLGEPVDFLWLRQPASARIFVVGERIAERIGTWLPPSRAPPALV